MLHDKSPAALLGFTIALMTVAGCNDQPSFEPTKRDDTNSVSLTGGRGIEFKLYVREGDPFQYTWSSTGDLAYDFHGEMEDDESGAFTSHKTGTGKSDSGTHVAGFTGTHGWFWENKGTATVTVTIRTAGIYDVVGETGKTH